MRITDIVVPYEEYSKGRIDCPELLLEFDLFNLKEGSIEERKINDVSIKQFKFLNNNEKYRKNNVEMNIDDKYVSYYKRDKAINHKIIISVTVKYDEKIIDVFFSKTFFCCPDFNLELVCSFKKKYNLVLKYDDCHVCNQVFNDDLYLKMLIFKLRLFIEFNESGQNKEEENTFFEYKKLIESGEWKNQIVYESDSCLIIKGD